MASSIFATLGYNFDDTKYGDAATMSAEGSKTLELLASETPPLSEWQQNDMASGAADTRTNYFENKQAGVISTIRTGASLILTIANTIPFANAANVQNTMITSATNCIIELDKYKSHTDNVSGVSNPSDFKNIDAVDIPHFDTATALSQQLLTILNQTDSIQNTTPLLGSMTSLFVKDDVTNNSIIITSDAATLNSTITTSLDANSNVIVVSNITTTAANSIISDLDSVTLFLNTRRTHDWNFFKQGAAAVRRHSEVTKFDNMGATQIQLVTNYCGTSTLVNNLSSG